MVGQFCPVDAVHILVVEPLALFVDNEVEHCLAFGGTVDFGAAAVGYRRDFRSGGFEFPELAADKEHCRAVGQGCHCHTAFAGEFLDEFDVVVAKRYFPEVAAVFASGDIVETFAVVDEGCAREFS